MILGASTILSLRYIEECTCNQATNLPPPNLASFLVSWRQIFVRFHLNNNFSYNRTIKEDKNECLLNCFCADPDFWVRRLEPHKQAGKYSADYGNEVSTIDSRNNEETGQRRNDTVREELKAEAVLEKVGKAQLRWFGHMVRMNNNRIVKRLWEARVVERKKRGRPAKTWENWKIVKKLIKNSSGIKFWNAFAILSAYVCTSLRIVRKARREHCVRKTN